MKSVIRIALFSLSCFITVCAQAQTTYQMDKSPFKCNSVTMQQITMGFYDFNCRGVFYSSGAIELFFNGGTMLANVFTPGWSISNAQLSLTSFTQPNPTFCQLPSTRIAGCPDNSTPGAFSFSFSGSGSDGLEHNVTVNGTWFNIQYPCGGCRSGGAWYAPTLETAALTVQ